MKRYYRTHRFTGTGTRPLVIISYARQQDVIYKHIYLEVIAVKGSDELEPHPRPLKLSDASSMREQRVFSLFGTS